MLRQDRNRGRSARLAGSILLGALIFASACASSSRPPEARGTKPIDPGVFVEVSKVFHEYIAALKLLDSPRSSDWEEGRRKLETLKFAYFAEDRILIEKFRTGTPEDRELSRKELARRGKMLELVLVFTRPYAPATWEHARREMMALGEGAPEFLTISLLKILIHGRFREVWSQIRYHLVGIGDTAFETTVELSRKWADSTPATPIWKQEDLVQLFLAILGFGERGRTTLGEFAKHRTWNVRKAVARAVGDSGDVGSSAILVGYLEGDVDWQVKAAAAEAMGRLRPAKRSLGPVLVERMKKERDAFVRHEIIRALGVLKWAGAVPDLMRVLELPNYETVQFAMESLYFLTGERLTTPSQWKSWYATSYPKWIQDQSP